MNNDAEKVFILSPSTSSLSNKLSKLNTTTEATAVTLEGVKNFSNVCRICATITELVIPIFDSEGVQNNLADKIHTHLPIQVSEQDVLPRVLCYQCASTLLAWHELVKCCEQADAAFRQKLEIKGQPTVTQATHQNVNRNIPKESQNKTNSKFTINDNVKTESDSNENFRYNRNKSVITKEPIPEVQNEDRYITCDICCENVLEKSLKHHEKSSHQVMKKYSCHACGLCFSDSGNLSRHTRALHMQLRPYVCTICHKSFSRNSHLQDHVETHAENRDYICDVCGKGSKSSAAFRMHKKTHDDKFRFQCLFCKLKFKRRGQLIAHVSVHTGEKAHICGCGKSFRLKSQLKSHSKVHNKIEETNIP